MSLRDQLLKAGKISEKQKRKAEKQQRHQEHVKRKTRKKDRPAPPRPDAPLSDAQLKALAAERAREQADEVTARHIINEEGRRRFHFEARNHEIHFLMVSDVLSYLLENGRAAIVERPVDDDLDHVTVSREAAARLLELAPERVRFFNQPG